MSQPTHEHHCQDCKYLGTVISKHRIGQVADLYHCDGDLIARYGDEPANHSNMPVWEAQGFQHTNLDLLEAYHRSQTRQ